MNISQYPENCMCPTCMCPEESQYIVILWASPDTKNRFDSVSNLNQYFTFREKARVQKYQKITVRRLRAVHHHVHVWRASRKQTVACPLKLMQKCNCSLIVSEQAIYLLDRLLFYGLQSSLTTRKSS